MVSIGLPRHPLAQQRIDHGVAAAGLARDEILAQQRRERSLNTRGAAEPVAKPRLGREQLDAVLEHDGAERGALRERQPLPRRLEQRVLLGQQPPQRLMQIFEPNRPSSRGRRVVPRLVRQALHVVGQITGELDHRGAKAGFRRQSRAPEPRLDERRDGSPSMRQALMMLNGKLTNEAARVGPLEPLHALMTGPKANIDAAIQLAYREILTRVPTAQEMDEARQIVKEGATPLDGMADLRWALFNCHEFRYLP